MNRHALAHISAQCCAISPCKNYVVFGTNFGTLIIIPLASFKCCNKQEDSELKVLTVPHGSSVYSLMTKFDYLWIGIKGAIVAVSWANIQCFKQEFKTIPFEINLPPYEVAIVTSLTSSDDSSLIFASSSSGYVYEINANYFTVTGAHKCSRLPIHSLLSLGRSEVCYRSKLSFLAT
ncbi:hypothetical protein Aperf_G00000047182 [Anoplocephala perfoliata]